MNTYIALLRGVIPSGFIKKAAHISGGKFKFVKSASSYEIYKTFNF